MPYIAKEARQALDTEVARNIETVGELNYMITIGLLEVPLKDLSEYIRLCIGTYVVGKPPSYTLYNGVCGACICALLEFARRTDSNDPSYALLMSDVISKFYAKVVAPYEDEKIEENGDLEGYARLPTLRETQPGDEECLKCI